MAGQNMADLGAEVIKVERPGAGDDSRAFGPPWVKDRNGRETKDSAYFSFGQPRQEIGHGEYRQPEGPGALPHAGTRSAMC
jgi:crotonobetainyl-CoA:carnitine CoA-transferase CaiB-like acyl-CoA transferase